MHAGLARGRGEILITMDGDLQNAPEDIPRLVAAVEAGADVASGRRAARHDSWGRTLPSRLINGMLRRFTGADISDFGCAFNAYRRDAIIPLLGTIGKQKFTKALVLSRGASFVEIDVAHTARADHPRYPAGPGSSPRRSSAISSPRRSTRSCRSTRSRTRGTWTTSPTSCRTSGSPSSTATSATPR